MPKVTIKADPYWAFVMITIKSYFGKMINRHFADAWGFDNLAQHFLTNEFGGIPFRVILLSIVISKIY